MSITRGGYERNRPRAVTRLARGGPRLQRQWLLAQPVRAFCHSASAPRFRLPGSMRALVADELGRDGLGFRLGSGIQLLRQEPLQLPILPKRSVELSCRRVEPDQIPLRGFPERIGSHALLRVLDGPLQLTGLLQERQ